jgi:hypothetical protein
MFIVLCHYIVHCIVLLYYYCYIVYNINCIVIVFCYYIVHCVVLSYYYCYTDFNVYCIVIVLCYYDRLLATDTEARVRFPALPKKKRVVGLERGPLSLVSTTEELFDSKVAAPV